MPGKPLESVSEAGIREVISESEALASVHKSKPSVADYVAEGVLDSAPEPDAEGQIDTQVRGHDRVVRMLQMNEEFYRKEADHFDTRRNAPRKASWREAHAEIKERKFFVASPTYLVGSGVRGWQYRCEHGHSFGFLPGQPSRHTRPCVRVGCESIATLERA